MNANALGSIEEFGRGVWYVGLDAAGSSNDNFMFLIPRGTKNIVINLNGTGQTIPYTQGENDIALFTRTGVHLAGTPLSDYVYTSPNTQPVTNIDANSHLYGFTSADYDGSQLNSGPGTYDPTGNTLAYSTYNGMTIGYSGDPDQHDGIPNDGSGQTWADYEVLTIDEATEDLIVALPGLASACFKVYSDSSGTISVRTQDLAQKALDRIDTAIVKKDKVRAHLGALQNRLENTVTNLAVQAENLQAAESRISNVDVATEMTEFVRNQILTQSATAMLTQANSLPEMLARLFS
ncbi:MAG: flagellin [Desulfovibrio sp.]|nr:flagellin [Desulfovibrio sp.]